MEYQILLIYKNTILPYGKLFTTKVHNKVHTKLSQKPKTKLTLDKIEHPRPICGTSCKTVPHGRLTSFNLQFKLT